MFICGFRMSFGCWRCFGLCRSASELFVAWFISFADNILKLWRNIYDYSFILFYNLVFTLLPIIALGGECHPFVHWSWINFALAFDQDLNAKAFDISRSYYVMSTGECCSWQWAEAHQRHRKTVEEFHIRASGCSLLVRWHLLVRWMDYLEQTSL